MGRQMMRQAQRAIKNNVHTGQPNPAAILDELMKDPKISRNPRVQQVMKLREQGDTAGLNKIGENLCSSNGVSYQDATEQFKAIMSQGYGYMFK